MTAGQYCYINIINSRSSHITIINRVVHTRTWPYRNDSWHNHIEWASKRCGRSHPHNLIRMVGKGQFHMFARTLNICQVKVKPLSIARIDNSTLSPVETNSIVATEHSTIIQIETKEHWLVRGNREIELCNIFSHKSIYQAEETIWIISCQIKPFWYGLADSSSYSIFAIQCYTKGYIRIFLTVVENGKLLQEIQVVLQELIGYSVPLGLAWLQVVLYALRESLICCFAIRWIYQCRNSFCFNLDLSTEIH